MGKLVLAEGAPNQVSAQFMRDSFIKMPNGTYVRADYFDDLDDQTYDNLLAVLEPLNTMQTMNGLSAWFSKMRDNRAERKATKQAQKLETIKARSEGRAAVAAAGGGLGGIVKNIAGIFTGGAQAPAEQMPTSKGIQFDLGVSTPRPWYQNPVVIIGGLAIVGTAVYLISKSKKAN